MARWAVAGAAALVLVLCGTAGRAADLEADVESLEACVLESAASGHERECIGILSEPCVTARCYTREAAIWRVILVQNGEDESVARNRRMQDGDWAAQVRNLRQTCVDSLPNRTEIGRAACDRDAYAGAAIDLLLRADDP